MTPPCQFNLDTQHLHTTPPPPPTPITMDQSKSVIVVQFIGSVHVLEKEVNGLWAIEELALCFTRVK